MWKPRSITTALVTSLLVVTAAACGGGSDSSSNGSGGTSAAASQMFTWVSNEGDRAQWQSFIDGAKQKDPNFTLTLEGPTFKEYWTKVKTRMAAPDAPCILTTQAARAQELEGILEPLDDLAKESGLDLTAYNPAMTKALTIDGGIRAVPYDAEPMVLYYNKDLFEAAGLTAPTTSYTRDQFVHDAKALTKDDVKGFAMASDMAYPFLPMAFANGHPPVRDGNLDLTNPEFVGDIQWVFDLAAKEHVADAPAPADTSDMPMQKFQAGKAAMIVDGPWFYTSIREGMTDEVGVAVVPSTSGKPIGMLQGSGFGISRKCPDKKAAFENIMKITTPEVLAYVGKERGIVPSLDAAMSGWAEGKPAADVEVMNALLKDGLALETTDSWNQVLTRFGQSVTPGARGDQSANDILSAIQSSAG